VFFEDILATNLKKTCAYSYQNCTHRTVLYIRTTWANDQSPSEEDADVSTQRATSFYWLIID
jgi:hypothetical protein